MCFRVLDGAAVQSAFNPIFFVFDKDQIIRVMVETSSSRCVVLGVVVPDGVVFAFN